MERRRGEPIAVKQPTRFCHSVGVREAPSPLDLRELAPVGVGAEQGLASGPSEFTGKEETEVCHLNR